jgi:heme/copper-type cytochrome/quinol oxidase subunit 4
MAETVYVLCAVTSVLCAVLLVRSYLRQRTRLLMWSALCFVGLALNSILMFVDLVVVPDGDLSLVRTSTAFIAVLLLAIGLVWEDS